MIHMLFRKVQKQIKNWIQNGKDALLITGARQVGKSFIIRETLKETAVEYVEFNFIKQPKLLDVFKSVSEEDADKFILALRVAANKQLKEGAIIFFDEIQEFKEIVTIIKFLVELRKFKYILSGSLLGVELTDLRSAPVGYLSTIDMYPMDLEEFFIANGLGDDVINELKERFTTLTPVNDFVHDKMINAFYTYLIVGGMPEAVQTYLDSNDFMSVSKVHEKIQREYKKDFTKYEKTNKLKLIKTYELIPSELNTRNKRYIFTNLDNELRFDRYENSFNWLNDAGVSIPVYNVTEFEVPLEASKKSNLFKLFLSDVGMLTTIYGSATILRLLEKGKDINCGSMFENAVAQELKSHGFKNYYFNSKKHGEVDFLIEFKNELLPIEVKSGKDYQKHSALSYFMSTRNFKSAIVLSNYNVSVQDKVNYLPIYMIMFFNHSEIIDKREQLNLRDLSNSKTGQ
ncbi:MAG: AAA family ATPase [Bacillus subtilis]|nr:AAA family ATPase [Bacillus subtilis]